MVFQRDFLRAEVLFGRYREPRARFDGRVVSDDDAQTIIDISGTGYYSTPRTSPLLNIHTHTHQLTHLQQPS